MPPSLCDSCQHLREIRTARSRFLLCELSQTNPAFSKYPPQPVVSCAGYLASVSTEQDQRAVGEADLG
jgi:hypothetical protein